MPKSALAIYLVKSLIDVSLAFQVQPQTELRNDQGGRRTTELEWVWSDEGGTCESACASTCNGAECSSLDRAEIDSSAKMTDLEAEMSTSECTSYSDSTGSGPYVSDGVCYPSDGSASSCSSSVSSGKMLCPCEIVLGTCTIAEDPHIHVFDDSQISMLLAGKGAQTSEDLVGEKWLVKSERVKVQARFEDMGDSKVFTRAIALSGEILNYNIMTVGSLEDSITWNGENILNDQQSSFYVREGSFFVNATRGPSSLVQDPSKENYGVNIRLASGVSLIVNRQHRYINVALRMPKQAGGQEGLCGNFNGLGVDDTLEMMNNRFNPKVSSNSLFSGIHYD